MKTIVLMFCLLIGISSVKADQWQVFSTPNQINHLNFINPNVGFIGGFSGLWRTSDAGESWTQIEISCPLIFHVNCYNQFGYTVGFDGFQVKVFKSSDAGIQWEFTGGSPYNSYGPIYQNENTCLFGVNNNVRLIENDGSSTTIFTHPGTRGLLGMGMSNSNTTYIATKDSIFISSPPYATWTARDNGNFVCTTRLSIFNDRVYLGGTKNNQAVVNSTFDQGQTWQTVVLDNGVCKNISFKDNIGYALTVTAISIDSSLTRIYRTTNGVSWEQIYQLNTPAPGLVDVWATDRYVYFGGNNTLLRYDSDQPLPVELSSFISNRNGNTITLHWTTTTETNNSGFEIERSAVSNPSWVTIGSVRGHGTVTHSEAYAYIDQRLSSDTYHYRLKQIDFNGNYEYHDLVNEVIIGTPEKFSLSQNYPNPFNPITTISYTIPYDGMVNLSVFDITGKEVASFIKEAKTAGYYSVSFNAVGLTSGIYLYRIESQNFTQTKKMTLIK